MGIQSPLSLALLFLLNVLIIAAGQILIFYRSPAQPDAASLASYDPVYEGSNVLISDKSGYLTAALVETSDKQIHLVVTKIHSLAYNRGRILYAEPVELPVSGEISVSVKNGVHTSRILAGNTAADFPYVTIEYGYSGTIREQSVLYLILAAVLEALELMAFHLIRKNLFS